MKKDRATHIEDKGYAYPDPATRRRTIVVAIAGGICALAVSLLLHSVVRPWLDRYLLALEELAKHDPAAADRSFLNVVGLMLGLSSSTAIGFGIWLFSTGRRMMRTEQWPRPGVKVYARVKILDKKSAGRRGRVLVILGLILAILAPAVGWKAYHDITTVLNAARPNK